MVRVVIHAEAFVRIRVAIDIRIVRYVVAAAAGLLILKGPQDHFQKLSHLKLIWLHYARTHPCCLSETHQVDLGAHWQFHFYICKNLNKKEGYLVDATIFQR